MHHEEAYSTKGDRNLESFKGELTAEGSREHAHRARKDVTAA